MFSVAASVESVSFAENGIDYDFALSDEVRFPAAFLGHFNICRRLEVGSFSLTPRQRPQAFFCRNEMFLNRAEDPVCLIAHVSA
ncbi:hypothetical protein CRM95_35955 [Burkholderia gladioli]|nr:hypothetical protein CRM95_35955 [Burkholderia gladioli]